ncbi:hypothetical protein Rrhod_3475 [Rhodococcus rhodnii LMG 5362]|uniref:34 kDa antigenic protein n=1 Tax=Rhodococcus rhodnii LMG 5362 TaxID=1273125 RepID=R7WMG3_9NOCA|nr:hypothetical protein Rrhod_3475 [Rhodococcus rhodnii LMG 5362]
MLADRGVDFWLVVATTVLGVVALFLGFAPYVQTQGAFGMAGGSGNVLELGNLGYGFTVLAGALAAMTLLREQRWMGAAGAAASVGFVVSLFSFFAMSEDLALAWGGVLLLVVGFVQTVVAVGATLIEADVLSAPRRATPPQQQGFSAPQYPTPGYAGYQPQAFAPTEAISTQPNPQDQGGAPPQQNPQPYSGQQYSGQSYSGQQYSGQQYEGQQYGNQQAHGGVPYQGQYGYAPQYQQPYPQGQPFPGYGQYQQPGYGQPQHAAGYQGYQQPGQQFPPNAGSASEPTQAAPRVDDDRPAHGGEPDRPSQESTDGDAGPRTQAFDPRADDK